MAFWNDPLKFLGDWLRGVLTGWGLGEGLAGVLVALIGIVVLLALVMVLDVFLVWIERKVVARFQDRLGPNRIGPFGLFQPFADIIKLLIKEDITPVGAIKLVYNFAPILALASVLLLWAVLPLAPVIFGVDLNVGALYLIAAGALGTLAVIMASWASNNKYALLGGFRMVATMISYEIPMVVTLLVPTVLAGTMGMNGIVRAQEIWYVLPAPLAALIFIISAIAELGRAPFDLNEAESEIVAGFHIEYTGMKFGLFYAGELLHAFTFGAFIATLFFGGWRGPFVDQVPLLGLVYLLAKALFFYWVIMWVKYTVPRIRIDHMLAFNWKFLTPLAFLVLIVTAVLNVLLRGQAAWLVALVMFLANLLIAWGVVEILRADARRQRRQAEAPAAPAAQAAHH